MIFPKWKLVIRLSSLLLGLVILVACNQTNEVVSESDSAALFSVDDISNALPTTISETIELARGCLKNI